MSYLGYVGESVRGNHGLIDVDKVVVITPVPASIANLLELPLEGELVSF